MGKTIFPEESPSVMPPDREPENSGEQSFTSRIYIHQNDKEILTSYLKS